MPSNQMETSKDIHQEISENSERPVFAQGAEAKRGREMRSAIWLFLYLARNADRKTGKIGRDIDTISTEMGISRSTIQRWLKLLRRGGCVETENTGRHLVIQIKNWNELTNAPNMTQQVFQNWDMRWVKNAPAQEAPGSPKAAQISPEMETRAEKQPASPIDISINNKLNIDIDKEDSLSPSANLRTSNDRRAKSKEELLALDLAAALDDIKGLPLYLSYARKYPEHLLRRVLGVVMEIPPEKVKRSRGALFNYLVQKYGNKNANNSGD
jgi:hypothetical protein